MAEIEVFPKQKNKEEQYQLVLKQVEALFSDESNLMANFSNLCSVLHFSFDFHWTGIYQVDGDELVLFTFQGPPACTRISKGKGVCGMAWKNGLQIVPNVHEFEGHIACSSETNSEIVLPITDSQNNVWGVLDIDSKDFNNFDEIDANYLNALLNLLEL